MVDQLRPNRRNPFAQRRALVVQSVTLLCRRLLITDEIIYEYLTLTDNTFQKINNSLTRQTIAVGVVGF